MKIDFQGTALIFCDPHIPFQDQRVIREVELFMEELQPDMIVYPGDIGDWYGISSFDKNPSRADRLQSDLSSVGAMFKRQRALCPNARMIEEDGNHEDRLRRHLWGKDPALASLDCLTVEKLYKLEESGVEHIPYKEGLLINGNFLITHGDLIRAHSSYTAKGMSDKYGGSGMHGHSHRLGSHYKKNYFGVYGWWENGCLCDLNPDYVTNPNWQQGFSLVHFTKSRFWVEQMQIIDRKFMYAGRTFGSGGKKRGSL